jgi:hypothetical protein
MILVGSINPPLALLAFLSYGGRERRAKEKEFKCPMPKEYGSGR